MGVNMKRKEIQRRINIERKYNMAKLNNNYIKIVYYTCLLLLIDTFDKLKKIEWKNLLPKSYKAEWEQQNILLDGQKKRIADLEKKIKKLEGEKE